MLVKTILKPFAVCAFYLFSRKFNEIFNGVFEFAVAPPIIHEISRPVQREKSLLFPQGNII